MNDARTRETDDLLPVNEVLDADLDLRERVEDVEFGEVEAVVAINHGRVFHHDEVKPPATSAAPSRGSPFSADFLEVDTGFLREL